ncbi:MAG: PorV/PorQ family protein [Rhizobacter sp.]|nr:PorV/PorQ family protein [Chlorobiales bacterium]
MKIFLRTLLSLLLSTLLLPQMLSAQTVIGKYAGEFLSLGAGARSLGMGGAAAALANDVTAGYWNVAGLSKLNYPQVAFMHAETFGNLVSYDYGAVAIPYQENKSFGLSLIRLGVADIPDTRDAYTVDGSNQIQPKDNAEDLITRFGAADYAVLLSYAAATPFNFSYGVSAKFIFRNIGDLASARGIGFDIGGMYEFRNGIVIGLALQDITTTFVSWSGTDGQSYRNELITPTAKLGGGYVIEAFSGRFTIGLDTDIRFDGRQSTAAFSLGPSSFNFRGGGEFNYKNIVAIRGGVDDLGRLTLGAGLRVSKLDIDYGFAQFNATDQLGNSHRISLQLELDGQNLRRKGYVPEPSPPESAAPESKVLPPPASVPQE